MALYLKLQITPPGLLENEKMARKIKVARFIANFLKVNDIEEELWLGPAIEALNGKLLARGDVILDELSKLSPIQATNCTYKLKGVYKDAPFLLLIHNKYYRSVYGDIYLSCNLFYDHILNHKDFQEVLKNSISSVHKSEDLKGTKVTFGALGRSPDVLEDIRERLMCYYLNSWMLVSDLFRAMKLESEEIRNPVLVNLLKPYSIEYLARKISRMPEFEEFFKLLSKKAGVNKIGGSLYLFAKSEDSFRKIYEMFRDDFLKNVRSEWYDDDRISGLIKRWLGKYSSLNEYP